ncbi:MAG TPA: TIGR00730 family Rossman fold protein [Burkholderiaceae bacterium]|nr:TIGR00730 family Rossman fold protein [Burkholderiaceae bacterium]
MNPRGRKFCVCVYCGSRHGERAEYGQAAQAVGTLIGRNGWELVYGGGRVGLMGTVADATLAAGGTVVGVIPQALMDREVGHQGLTELHVVQTMHERKQLMATRAHAFLALAGGIGTFEELFEMWTWRQLRYHDKPIGLLNTAGYYDSLLAFIDQTVEGGFVTTAQRAQLIVAGEPTALLQRLATDAQAATVPDDYSKA